MMSWLLTLHVLLLVGWLTVMMGPTGVGSKKLFDIHWNTSNPIFRIDNTDHIMDVNKGNIAFEYDQVNLICPVYSPGTKEEDMERYIIYNVSKEEYDSCRITDKNSKIIAVCDKPHQLMYFTITFRSFTPQPNGLEFRPGQDYYFISTSSGDEEGLHQRIGGRCATHNMKVIFKVCCSPSESPNTQSTSSISSSSSTTTTTTPASSMSSMSTSFSFPESVSTTTTMRWRPFFPPTKFPPYKTHYDVPTDEGRGKTSSKKTEDRDKLPNETRAKNEELVNNRACSEKSTAWASLLATSALALIATFLSR